MPFYFGQIIIGQELCQQLRSCPAARQKGASPWKGEPTILAETFAPLLRTELSRVRSFWLPPHIFSLRMP
jgi:hypothetical protein